jgi:hypothetical protein
LFVNLQAFTVLLPSSRRGVAEIGGELTHTDPNGAVNMRLLVFVCCLQAEAFGFTAAPNSRSLVPRAPITASKSFAQVQRTQDIICQDGSYSEKAVLSASILGLASQPIMWWSLYTLKTTGCGLPAGPFGLLGVMCRGVAFTHSRHSHSAHLVLQHANV